MAENISESHNILIFHASKQKYFIVFLFVKCLRFVFKLVGVLHLLQDFKEPQQALKGLETKNK